jgi:hypothetical protein
MGNIGLNNDFHGNVKPSSVEQAVYERDLCAGRMTEIPSNLQMRAAYSSTDGQPDYVGFAPRGLAEGTNGWLLQKFAYDASRQCTSRTIAYGDWTNRATETYA